MIRCAPAAEPGVLAGVLSRRTDVKSYKRPDGQARLPLAYHIEHRAAVLVAMTNGASRMNVTNRPLDQSALGPFPLGARRAPALFGWRGQGGGGQMVVRRPLPSHVPV